MSESFKPLISILQDVDRDPDVRVVMRSQPVADDEVSFEIVVTVEVRDRKRQAPAWGLIPGHLARYTDAFQALSWATIALENAISAREHKVGYRKLKPFQKVDD